MVEDRGHLIVARTWLRGQYISTGRLFVQLLGNKYWHTATGGNNDPSLAQTPCASLSSCVEFQVESVDYMLTVPRAGPLATCYGR